MSAPREITSEHLNALAGRTVYFGHQSVGANVLDGLRQVAAERAQFPMKIVSTDPVAAPGVLNEFGIGENGDPESKNAAFVKALERDLGPQPVLMFKYCFVDVDDRTDVPALFTRYQETVATLRKRHPHAAIVHVTMPLTKDSVFRNLVNSIRGRPTRRDRNAVRAAYNELLRATYGGKEPIFDLAAVESTRADGNTEHAVVGRLKVYALASEWASDDGHLNEAGRKRAAEELLLTLASLPADPRRRDDAPGGAVSR